MAQTTAVRQRHSTRRVPPRRRSVLGTIVQVCGELLITAGVVLLLFVAWELWWTNIAANAKQQEVVESLAESFDLPAVPP
ncbi:MAG TPA: class E sortase, partial [Arthrobacter sp.]|nr:class E sortase [Arthrobacter sp.]